MSEAEVTTIPIGDLTGEQMERRAAQAAAAVEKAGKAVDRAERHLLNRARDRDRAIWEAVEAGCGPTQVARLSGISRQRVYQIVADENERRAITGE